MKALQSFKTSLLGIAALGLLITAVSPSYAGRFQQNHPRRAEVMQRDNGTRNTINQDRGQLNGHYKQLSHEDNRIRRQQQRDARRNDGHITKGEQNHLNREENRMDNQINRDHR
jgi:hypothetical protein